MYRYRQSEQSSSRRNTTKISCCLSIPAKDHNSFIRKISQASQHDCSIARCNQHKYCLLTHCKRYGRFVFSTRIFLAKIRGFILEIFSHSSANESRGIVFAAKRPWTHAANANQSWLLHCQLHGILQKCSIHECKHYFQSSGKNQRTGDQNKPPSEIHARTKKWKCSKEACFLFSQI